MDTPQFIIGAMTHEECDYIMDVAKPKLEFSKLSHNGHLNYNVRMSEQCFIPLKEDNRLRDIISRHVKDVDRCENVQVLRYKTGGFYREHYDACEYQKNKRERTILIGLNDGYDYDGGETYFPIIKEAYKMRKGDALTFRNIDGKGEILQQSIHGGAPVLTGEKWICTVWVRQRKLEDGNTEEDHIYSKDDYEFSQITHDDVDELIKLEKESYSVDSERPGIRTIKRVIEECPDLTMLVRHEGSIVAAMYGGLMDGIEITEKKINDVHNPDGDTLTVHSISVKKTLKGKGLGDFVARYYYDDWLPKSKYNIKYYSVASRPQYMEWMSKLGFTTVGPSKVSYGTEYWIDYFKFAPPRV